MENRQQTSFDVKRSTLNINCIATIGSFDGVHRGHQCLLSQVRHIADERGLRAMAITFGTSPRSVLGKGDCSKLTTADERALLLRQVGMDEVAVLDFTPQMAAMTARDFMQQVLREQLHVAVLVIGYDHRFGRGRSEGFDDYVRYGQEMGIEVVRGEACTEDGEPVSSTRIRSLLEEGEVDEAALLLGYRYTLRGKVVGGYREGRKMGFPTANIALDEGQQTTDKVVDCKLIPADGVYAVWVKIGQQTTDKVAIEREQRLLAGSAERSNFNEVNRQRTTDKTCAHEPQEKNNFPFSIFHSQLKKGMLNIGYRPTLNNGKERSIEVHILDFEGDLYGKGITVEFAHRLREERTFANTEELTEQLMRDEKKVRELLVAEE